MKIALYRKYRPKTFEEMLGQDHITQTLKNAISELSHSHAYIFTGPRGVGKTSAARLLATAINCLDLNGGDPCGKCENCHAIIKSRAVDIIEIDAASNRGIDEMRELKEKAKFSPNKLKYKVFIIDEVHMLTKEAFNALLKTLEEPPSHTIFILATTETHKVPQTILSRCQRFDFKRISINDLVTRLSEISKKENIKITMDALALIAESSEGGFRDAISALDQISSYKKEIKIDDVVELLGMSDYKTLIDFSSYLISGDAKTAIELVNGLTVKGIDISQFTKNLLEFLRKLMLFQVLGGNHLEIATEHIAEIEKIIKNTNPNKLAKFIEIILENNNSFKNAPLPQMPLEISIVQICIDKDEIDLGKAELPKLENLSVPKKTEIEKEKPKEEKYEKLSADDKALWHDFLLEIKGISPNCHSILKLCVHSFEDNKIVLTFPFKFHKERMDDRKNRKDVEEALKRVYNRSYDIVTKVKEEIKNRIKEEHEKKEKELTVKAVDIFGGEIVN